MVKQDIWAKIKMTIKAGVAMNAKYRCRLEQHMAPIDSHHERRSVSFRM